MSRIVKLPVANVIIGERHRKDLGDLDGLARSILAVGLLHPIVVDERHRLIAGERRLAAWRQLHGDAEPIPAYVAGTFSDAMRLLAEQDENTCRKPFAPSEAVALGVALEAIERPKAKERQRAGGQAGGQASGKLPEASTGRARDIVGPAVGMSGRTYLKAKAVVAAAEDRSLAPEDRAVAQEAVEMMDRTGKVSAAYNKVKDTTAAPPKIDKTRAGVALRRARIAELAASGHTRAQIAKALGITVEGVAAVVKDHGIAVPADTMSRARKVDAVRIIENLTTTLEGLVTAASLIDYSALPAERVPEWADSIALSLKQLTNVTKQLKELGP